jgi:hypothetical protein
MRSLLDLWISRNLEIWSAPLHSQTELLKVFLTSFLKLLLWYDVLQTDPLEKLFIAELVFVKGVHTDT